MRRHRGGAGDYRDGAGAGDLRRVGIAAAGTVDVRAIETFDSTSPRWADLERRFGSELQRMKRSRLGVSLSTSVRIPGPTGEVWLFEGRDATYQIQLWAGTVGGSRIHVVKEEAFGSDPLVAPIVIEPIGAIWGLDHLAALVAEQGWEGGGYAIVSIRPGEVLTLVDAGSFGC